MQLQFQTNLNCGSCVAKVKPFLDSESSVTEWSVDTTDARKVLTVHGEHLNPETIKARVAESGFRVLSELAVVGGSTDTAAKPAQSLRPLVLIFAFILGATLLQELQGFTFSRAMNNFMGGFFLVFSFFKFLDLKRFADAYGTYDLLAKRFPAYARVYPFLELVLGVAYLSQNANEIVLASTVLLMGVSSLGVLQALRQKRAIECACLGTVFNLPMTKVTLFEDLLMVVMALWMLLVFH